MNDFQRTERDRAFARVIVHLQNAHALIRAAAHENDAFALGLGEIAALDRKLLHEINICAHVYKQPLDHQP